MSPRSRHELSQAHRTSCAFLLPAEVPPPFVPMGFYYHHACPASRCFQQEPPPSAPMGFTIIMPVLLAAASSKSHPLLPLWGFTIIVRSTMNYRLVLRPSLPWRARLVERASLTKRPDLVWLLSCAPLGESRFALFRAARYCLRSSVAW